ncbi:hypothetical protein BTVI_90208 [Pitangus sulphuratus]|nr:hypothetical protein BTVI_90208 [Pitangus sulphuratus]
MFLLKWEAQNWTQDLWCGLTNVEHIGTITTLQQPLVLLATIFLIEGKMPLVFLAAWARCWLMFNQLVTSIPQSFHRITEHSELEGTHKDHRVQLLALHRTIPKSNTRIPWGACSSAQFLLDEETFSYM